MNAYRHVLGWAFERLYREFAWTYDGVAWVVSRGLWRRWVLTVLPHVRGRVLELGSGPGHLQRALQQRSPGSAFGLDRSPFMIAQGARRLRRSGLPASLVRASTQQLPLQSASCDTVVATFPAEYIFDSRTHAEIRRVLAPDGRLVLVLGAELLGGGLPERLIDLAYRLTLQRSTRPTAVDPPLPFMIAGMRLRALWESVGRSRVLLVIGELEPLEDRDGARP
ncbi:MAG: methyltransferase domain-containing protein [Oscillochloris sp.]|nr:methyltransferase domain-containing protein [Oscillochloris sp.]